MLMCIVDIPILSSPLELMSADSNSNVAVVDHVDCQWLICPKVYRCRVMVPPFLYLVIFFYIFLVRLIVLGLKCPTVYRCKVTVSSKRLVSVQRYKARYI